MRKLKRDWYDLDFLYLKENGLFGAFRIYKDAEGFQNRYLDFFSVEAFDNRREYITDHYLSGKDGVDREYPYFNKDEMEKFVTESAGRIIKILSSEYGITAMI